MNLTDGYFNENFYKIQIWDINFTLQKRYTNVEKIGFGTQGYSIKACDEKEECDVTIEKLTRPFTTIENVKYLHRKLSILNNQRHPNIIKWLNVYIPGPNVNFVSELYLVTEFANISLSDVIFKQNIKLRHEQISFLLYQALCAINHLNLMGVIHKNLNPESFMVNNNCSLKLVDFGSPICTTSNISLCTKPKPYRAPELIFDMLYNFNVDIWSLALIFAELFMSYSMEKPMQIFNLFSGIDHNEQWLKIIKLLGTPRDKFIDRTKSCKNWILKFPNYESKSWDDILPDNCFPSPDSSRFFDASMAREMLSKMLVIDPEERYTVEKALEDSYVRCWKKDEEVNSRPKRKYDDTIERNKSMKIDDWKDLFFEQIKQFEETNAVMW